MKGYEEGTCKKEPLPMLWR